MRYSANLRVAELEHLAAFRAHPGAMDHSWWPAGVVSGSEAGIEREVADRPGQDQHLLVVVVHGRAKRRGVEARVPAQDAGQAHAVVVAGEHALPDAGRDGRPLDGADGEELERGFRHEGITAGAGATGDGMQSATDERPKGQLRS